MLTYWLLFGFWAIGSLQSPAAREQTRYYFLFIFGAVVTALIIGLRFEVGGDWKNYLEIYQNMYFLEFRQAIFFSDPGYAFVSWIAARTDLGIVFVNFACAVIFSSGLFYLCWKQPNPYLAALVAVPYLIIVVAMGYTRQSAAIGLICFAVADSSERRLVRIVVLVGIAALFHKSAALMLPVILGPVLARNYLLGIIGGIACVVLFYLVLRSSADALLSQYVTSNYDSQGALIRVAMNVLAAALFLYFRKRIDLPYFQKFYWTICSIIALLSIVALSAASASSGVDRFSLYLIPLQLIIYCRLPILASKDGKPVPSVLLAVLFYSFVVQATWLFKADNAEYWLPYKSALWG
ncbi:EpsG family protein [uncultured Sphingomonas sp.]|uniref:EpsG family protein n=1 Tax=uncultured Sphingomonas sp. TaxID=158754 RepID=UPI002588CDCF|nr:EpsG family protein [uncultured Sphingomonas sp.]